MFEFDLPLATAFLATIDPKRTKWDFVFVLEMETADQNGELGERELIEDYETSRLKGFAPLKQNAGCGVFVRHPDGEYIRVPGSFNLTGVPVRVTRLDADSALARIREGGTGDLALEQGGKKRAKKGRKVSQGEEVEAVSVTLSKEHRERLRERGVSDTLIDDAGAYTLSAKKEISDRLNKPRWQSGDVLCIPHLLRKDDDQETAPVLAYTEAPIALSAHHTVDALWGGTPYAIPFFPPTAFDQYAQPGTTFIVLDTLDALYAHTLSPKVVGAESVEAFFDAQHLQRTGEEAFRTCVVRNLEIKDQDFIVVCYPRSAGKKRHEAYKLGAQLKKNGASRVGFVEVKKSSLFVQAKSATEWAAFTGSARMPTDKELDVTRESMQDVLGEDLPAHSKALLIPKDFEIKPDGELVQYSTYQTAQGAIRTATKVSSLPFFLTRVLRDYESGEETYDIAYKIDGNWKTRPIEADSILKRNQITTLGRYGLPISDKNALQAVAWLHDMKELNVNEKRFEVVDSFRRTGWHSREDGSQFYVWPGKPDTTFDGADNREELLRPRMSRAGSLQGQLEMYNTLMKQTPAGVVALLAAAAGTLIGRLSNATNLFVHLYGETTGGKSMLASMAGSFHGNAKKMLIKGDTTRVGLEHTLATLSGTVVPFDETTGVEMKSRESIAYMAYEGVGKTRGKRDGGTQKASRWQTAIFSTGEEPYTSENMHSGAQARVLNVRLDVLPAGFASSMYSAAAAHHGHTIDKFGKFLNEDVDWDEIENLYFEFDQHYQEICVKHNINIRTANNTATLAIAGTLLKRCFGAALALPEDIQTFCGDFVLSEELTKPEIQPEYIRALTALQGYVLQHPNEVADCKDSREQPRVVIARKRTDGHFAFSAAWVSNFIHQAGFNARSVRAAWIKHHILLPVDEKRADGVMRLNGKAARFVVLDGECFIDNSLSISVQAREPEPDGGGDPPPSGGGGDGSGGGNGSGGPGNVTPLRKGRTGNGSPPAVPLVAKTVGFEGVETAGFTPRSETLHC